jgi:hypothetical protein
MSFAIQLLTVILLVFLGCLYSIYGQNAESRALGVFVVSVGLLNVLTTFGVIK